MALQNLQQYGCQTGNKHFQQYFNYIRRPVLVVQEAGIPGRTTDHGQATGKLQQYGCQTGNKLKEKSRDLNRLFFQ
jgi:hypothetical protein